MASSESNTFEGESNTAIIESVNMPIETTIETAATSTSTATDAVTGLALAELEVDNKTVLNSNEAPSRSASYRAVRLSQSDNGDEAEEEDPWWSEVENSDLLLDQVPNVTSVFTPSPEAILERSISESESESILKDDNFDRLHKIADKIKMTLSEHAKNKELEELQAKERKISETKETVTTTTTSSTENKEQSLEEFKEELRTKRLQRQNAVQDLRDEINTLRQQLQQEREINRRLRRGEHVEERSSTSSSLTAGASGLSADDDENPLARSRHANIELAEAQLALQMAQSENIELRGELAVVQKQVVTLKEVIACCKQMLAVKEEQCNELKQRLTEIEKSFAEHEMKIMSDNLRQEYERQLLNIRQLKQLYEERQRVAAAEYENLQRLISIKRDELAQEQEKSKALEERNENLAKEIETANNELACLRDECKEHKFEKAALKEEIGAVNTLFSQMVMGFNGKNNLDIDRLTTMLEENRTLLNDMATKEFTDGATLPKLLFELVEQASTATPDDSKKPPSTATSQHSRSPTPSLSEESNTTIEDESEQDNENMATLTSNVKHTFTTTQAIAEPQTPVTCPTNMETANATTTDSPDGKVMVTLPNKLKKHHRKISSNNNNRKSSSAAHTSCTAAATMELHDAEIIGKVTSAQEIIGNLPKVWRVLMELLSHHKIDPVQFEENGKGEDCYKSVETPNGPKAELSVSKTYLKLKDLILEKKSLVKETNRLKTLNSHLDYRLNEQEKRLSAVSLELTKTWHLVGKMQRQHRQLHTQEQILRYQLQQKRRLLSELKDELEHCRRKWAAARAKNDESQEQCNDLRREFARRKLEDANNSAESGYSDSGGPVSDEEAALPAEVVVSVDAQVSGVNVMKNAHDGDDELDDDDDDDEHNLAGNSTAAAAAGGCVNYRRKRLRELFEHTRKIKRMQSTSPGRAGNIVTSEDMVLRWNSAPPTCGWRDSGGTDEEEEEEEEFDVLENADSSNTSSETGAIPKVRSSRRIKRRSIDRNSNNEATKNTETVLEGDDRTNRIQRLEQQCKTLIKQVLETSDNRERLEVQLKRFQDEMSPVQYAVPLEEFINKKRLERMTRASSVPVTGSGCLTPREEEYTRKRSERLERLEEESRQLMSRIKRTSDRGHYLRCSLDRIRRAPASREGSFESNTEEDVCKPVEEDVHSSSGIENSSQENSQTEKVKASPLTEEEEAYTARRAARLQRLEEESKQLLTKLSKNNQRGDRIGTKLDTLHERYRSQEDKDSTAASSSQTGGASQGNMSVEQRIENIEKISSNREERLRILEEEGRQLINRLSETSEKGTKMINRIAERELNRQKRSPSTPTRDPTDNNDDNTTSEDNPVAAALLPTPKTVACSSIVAEELRERVTITTTASQIAAHQGAIPKSKPSLQLLAARPKSARLQKSENKALDNPSESLEDMVRRLQNLPFPGQQQHDEKTDDVKLEEETETETETEMEITTLKEDIAKFEEMDSNKLQVTTDTLENETQEALLVADHDKEPPAKQD